MTGTPTDSATAASGDLLVCESLRKAYGSVQALRGASLRVREGTVHGLVGQNGAGKSTLVRIVTGLTDWDGGSVAFDGRPVAESGRRAAIERGIWAAPQELTILPGMTVAENVCVGGEPGPGPLVRWSQMRERAQETLSRLGLTELSPRAQVDDLDPSRKRMVMIAMAVSRSCRLLILDEPTASLGTDEAGPLLDLVESLPGRGITVLYVSHRLDEIERLCDRVTVMRDGVTRETLARGEFDSGALVAGMVEELPPRPPRSTRSTSGPPVVSLRGVHGRSLRGVDVEIAPHAITGFTGLVGSGADELLQIVAGAARPAAGTVAVDGEPVDFHTPADALGAGIGYVPGVRASAALVDRSVRENVLASSMERVARLGVLLGGREREAAVRSVEGFGLAGRVDRGLGELSGGNQQKVLVGRLLAADVKVLVINDPTAGVDVHARADLHELLRQAADDGRTVIVRCSEPEELLDIADRIHVLAGGRLASTFDGEDVDVNRLLQASASSGAALADGGPTRA